MQEGTDQRRQWNNAYASVVDFFGKEPSELVTYALATFEDNRSRDILELGCGQGRDTWFLVNSGFEVSALDYSEESISQMKERAKGVGANVTLKVHDAREDLPFPDDSFDAIYSNMFFTMDFTDEEISKMLIECLRVLRPGGVNIFSVRNDHDPHYGKFTPKRRGTWQNPNGFVVHFFTEEEIRLSAIDYDILWIKEFEDPSPSFTKKLYGVAMRKPSHRYRSK